MRPRPWCEHPCPVQSGIWESGRTTSCSVQGQAIKIAPQLLLPFPTFVLRLLVHGLPLH